MKKRFLIIYLTNNKMKTPREKAIEYCMEVEGEIHQPYIDAFLAGCQSENEWISVEDELPKDGTYIVMTHKGFSQEDISFIFYENSDESDLKANFTHWRPINND